MNVVIYARAASQLESSVAIDRQIVECMKCAEDNGRVVVGQYTDAGITCVNTEQTGFARMISELELQNVQGVLVSNINRFSRSLTGAMEAKTAIKKSGMEILSVTGTDLGNNVMLELVEAYKESCEREA